MRYYFVMIRPNPVGRRARPRMRTGAAAVVCAACLAQGAGAAETPRVVGWIERIMIGPPGVVLEAKLDTGADTSSLHVSNLRWVSDGAGDRVAFDVSGEDGRTVRLVRRVERVAHVKSATGGAQRRPVIVLGVCLDTTYREVEVNLTDRTGFRQSFLVGRNFLARHFSVDASRQHTVEPDCEVPQQ